MDLGTREHSPARLGARAGSRLFPSLGSSWPLVVFLAGFPLWWLLGFGVLGFLLLALPLGYQLLRRRAFDVPPGFGVWLLFLAVVVLGFFVLWEPIPGLLPESGPGRILPWAYRVGWFIAVTIVLLFIGNSTEKELPTRRVILLMGWMFVITVVGGYAGQFLSRVDFPSLLEVVLPESVASNTFLNNLIHPGLAQIQSILGYETPRPKAPFEYANSWGANFGMFLPFFLLSYRYTKNAFQRVLFVIILVAAIPPAIFTLNRGLWLALLITAGFASIHLAVKGRWLAMISFGVAGTVGYLVLLLTPLADLILARLDNPHSDAGRSNLADTVLEVAITYSPIIGFGAPRSRQSNFYSVAGGATAECHQCAPPQLGTQGTLWYLIFATGFLGLVLFLYFVVRRSLPALVSSDPTASVLFYPVLFFICVMPFYDTIASPLMTLMICLGLLWRFEQQRDDAGSPHPPPKEAIA